MTTTDYMSPPLPVTELNGGQGATTGLGVSLFDGVRSTTGVSSTRRQPRYRTARSEWTRSEYDQNLKSFAPLPVRWLEQGLLASLWRAGGVGAISILPVLAQRGQGGSASHCYLSREYLARVCGCSHGSIDNGRAALAEMGLATAKSAWWNGRATLRWDCSPLSVRMNNRIPDGHAYFRFALIYGGHWRVLTAAQRAVYLVLLLSARLHGGDLTGDNEASNGERVMQRYGMDENDIASVPELADGGPVRLALGLSQRRIAELSGLSRSAVEQAVSCWHVDTASDLSPVVSYPADGCNVYRIRDVPPLSWNGLNADLSLNQTRRYFEAELRQGT